MPRNIPAPTLLEANKQFGTEPIVIVEIEWSSGKEQYGDKTFTLGTMNVQGKLVDASPMASNLTTSNAGEFSSFSVQLDDTDSTIKAKVNSQLIEGTVATVYHHFQGLTEADLMVIMKGKIYGDVIWDEANRVLDFTLEQFIEENEIGFSLEDDEITDQAEDVSGKSWPVGFGRPVHVPALRIVKADIGELAETITEVNGSFEISGGENFEQDVTIEILIGSIKYEGQFDNNEFTPSGVNLAHNINLSIAERVEGDIHFNDAKVLWLVDDNIYLEGHYLLIDHSEWGNTVNYCVKQIGNKYIFRKAWTNTSENTGDVLFQILMDENELVLETAPVVRITWPVSYRWEIVSTRPLGNPGFNDWAVPYDYQEVWQAINIPQGKFTIRKTAFVKEIQDFNDLYVFNVFPSVSVLQVFGKRTFEDEEIFVPIPSSYYLKNLDNLIAGQNASTLEFPITLEQRTSEDWTGEVFVSYISTIGPNVAKIIKHIVNTYTALTMDDTTFSATRLLVDPFPANFAIFDEPDALEFIKQVAYLARVALIVRNGEIVLKYLSEIPITDATVTEEAVQVETLKLGFTAIEEVITRIDATFVTDYSGRIEKDKIFSYKNNISLHGLKRDEVDWFIYTSRKLVSRSVGFWGNRLSNIWRKWEYNTFIENMDLQVFDVVANDIDILSENSIRGELELQSHDTSNASLQWKGTLASKAGESTDGQPIEDTTYWTGDPSIPITDPGIIDPCPGCEEEDEPVPVEGGGGEPVPDDDVDPLTTTEFQVKWDVPRSVQRGVDFEIRVTAIDADGLNANVESGGSLTLTSSDVTPDVLSGDNVNFNNGVYIDTGLQINNGAGSDIGSFSLAPSNEAIVNSTSPQFRIHDAPAFTAVCTRTGGSTLTRDVAFTMMITGGTPGITLNVSVSIGLVAGDNIDILYLDGTDTPVLTIMLDGGGNFSSPAWEIRGGQRKTSGRITFVEPGTLIRPVPDAPTMEFGTECPEFDLEGMSPVMALDRLGLGEFAFGNDFYCELTVDPILEFEADFEITLEIFFYTGIPATTFNGFVTIKAEDTGDDDIFSDFTKVCDNTENYVCFIIGEIVNGVWTCSSLQLDLIPVIGPVKFTARVTLQDEPEVIIKCEETASISGVPSFNVVCPLNFIRGVPTDVTIQALLGDSTPDTTFVPAGNVDFVLTSTDIDTLTPLFTDNTGWVNGRKTVSMTIDDGAGSDTGSIGATDSITGFTGICNISIDAAITIVPNNGDMKGHIGSLNFHTTPAPQNAADWALVQTVAQSNFLADTLTDPNQGISGQFREVEIVNHISFEPPNTFTYFGDTRMGYMGFNITAPQRAGAIAWTVEVASHQFYNEPQPPIFPAQYSYTRASQYTAKYFWTEVPNFFATGAAMAAMIPDVSHNLALLTNIHEIVVNIPSSFIVGYALEMPLSILQAMTGGTIYLWVYIDGPNIPFGAEYQGTVDGQRTREASVANARNASKINIYK